MRRVVSPLGQLSIDMLWGNGGSIWIDRNRVAIASHWTEGVAACKDQLGVGFNPPSCGDSRSF